MPPFHLADPDVVVMECSVGVEQVALPKRPMRRNMSIHEGDMKRRLLFTALIACSMLAGATPPPAGDWNYGCKRGLRGTAVIFDRNAPLIMPKALGKGEDAGFMKSQKFTFETPGKKSRFLPGM